MTRPISIRRLIPLITMLVAAPVCASWDDTSHWTYDGPESEVSIFVLPGGDGDPLSACRAEFTAWGQSVDATLTVTLIDWSDQPLAGVPAEDVWLETTLQGYVPCAGGSIADGPSDVNGVMTFSGPLRGGGHSDRVAGEKTVVVYNGAVTLHPGFDIRVNSPDLDGDLDVDIEDVILFTRMYPASAGYHYAIDYHFDGVNDLSDLIRFLGTVHTRCE